MGLHYADTTMSNLADGASVLMQGPSGSDDFPTHSRLQSVYKPLSTFVLSSDESRSYQHQFADMYFLRLAELKPAIEQVAESAFQDYTVAGERARRVDRVLDVRQGDLCWVVGTIYMEMALKPNVLDDISKEHWIAAPPPREKFFVEDGAHAVGEQVMLEDESGRLKLSGGPVLRDKLLVTGCVVAVLGTENRDGEFEVMEIVDADLPRQSQRWDDSGSDGTETAKDPADGHTEKQGGKIAIVSGLDIDGTSGDAIFLDQLTTFLKGEGPEQHKAIQITRLIIAGDSLADSSPIPSREEMAARKGQRKYGYDSSAFNPGPTQALDAFLTDLLPTLPITLLPGESDPANVSLPQQPLHAALFPQSRQYAKPAGEATPYAFDAVTNPWLGRIDGHLFLGSAGQNISDIYRYVDHDDRLAMLEATLRWRLIAPTAPDTLWSYPFQEDDPLLLRECPHVAFVGCQPAFDSRVIVGEGGPMDGQKKVRLVAVPKLRTSGVVVLLDSDTLEVEAIQLEIVGEDKGDGGDAS